MTKRKVNALKEGLKAKSVSRVAQAITDVCNDIANLLITKNQEYGNSALEPVRIFSKADPKEQLLVRIDDKLSRIATVGPQAYGATIKEDTIKDLLGYLVLYQVALRLEDE